MPGPRAGPSAVGLRIDGPNRAEPDRARQAAAAAVRSGVGADTYLRSVSMGADICDFDCYLYVSV
jgi:hypothetical protein